MKFISHIHSIDKLKILGDARRVEILRQLMTKPATITQLGKLMNKHPAWVKHHLDVLRSIGAVQISHIDISSNRLEKYYSASSSAYYLENLILPHEEGEHTLYFMGSHDLVVESLARVLAEKTFNLKFYDLYTGSLDGLILLRRGLAQISGCHLFDEESGQFNLPFLRHLFPDVPIWSVTLAHREQGLILPQGNPKGIHKLGDLGRNSVRLINRNPGSGTRIWLDRQLSRIGIDPKTLEGYQDYKNSHIEIAQSIATGKADVGLGLRAAAHMFDLEFIPLFEERYDLVFKNELKEQRGFAEFLDYIQGKEFRLLVESIPGYRANHTGDMYSPIFQVHA